MQVLEKQQFLSGKWGFFIKILFISQGLWQDAE